LIRKELWPPDGKPPTGWDERREGSVLKRLLMHRSVSQVEVAILGLAQLRDSGDIAWLARGQKVTSRALYNSRSGASQMFALATDAYWRIAKQRPKRGFVGIAASVEFAMRRVERGARADDMYTQYMQSPAWQARRAKRLALAGLRCEGCTAYGVPLEVHHLHYRSLGHEEDADLEVLCKPCHNQADAERRRARS
jgi:hypothetical protein